MTDSNAIKRIYELLDERGIDYKLRRASATSARETVFWEYEKDGDWATAEYALTVPQDGYGNLNASRLTPEQAVAATLGGGECTPHGEWERVSQTQEVRHVYCECGRELGMDRRDSFPFERTHLFAMPNYCQECGRKIRKMVKR